MTHRPSTVINTFTVATSWRKMTHRPSTVIKTDEEIRLAAQKRMKGKKGAISKAAEKQLQELEEARAQAQAAYDKTLGMAGPPTRR